MTAEGGAVLRSVPRDIRRPSALPELHTEVVGRAVELERIRDLVLGDTAARLVTLVGTGGVGKTTLAVVAAGRLSRAFEGSVVFAPVTVATTPAAAITEIARAAGWEVTDDEATREAVTRGLAAGPTLLVLDNCEQVDGLDTLVSDLLTACRDLVVLATSRRPVGLAAERLVAIEPLAVPDRSAGTREVVGNDAAVVLTNAARRRNAAFTVTSQNAGAVADLCRRLDGLPLALELAAARLHLLGPQELLRLLDRRFEVLKVDAADRADRHRRLWATIDWSYQLLDAADQARFRALGVFADGFSLDAAATVADCGPVEMLDTLDRLVGEHLVLALPSRFGAARFGMLESIREFAVAELDRTGALAATRRAHAEWALKLAERWGPAMTDGDEQVHAAAVFDGERANLRAALQNSLDDGAVERELAIATAMWRYWWMRGMAGEGRDWLEAGLARNPPVTVATAAGYVAAGDLAEIAGDLRRAGDLVRRALQIYEDLDVDDDLASAWNSVGFVERELGNLERAAELHQQALAVSRRLRQARQEAAALNGLGAVANRAGDHAAAAERFGEALAIMRKLGDRYAVALLAGNVAMSLMETGNVRAALTMHREVLEEATALGDMQSLLVTLVNLAECEIRAGELDAAEYHIDEAERVVAESGNAQYPAIIAHHRGRLAETRGLVGEALGHFVSGLQMALDVVRPIETAEFLERIGAVAAELGEHRLAARTFSAARAGRAATSTRSVDEVARWERVLADRGESLDPASDDSEWPAPAAALLRELTEFADANAGARRALADEASDEDPLCRLGLTRREAEVARRVVQRRTDLEISNELYIAVRTVGTHVSAVLRKLGVSSRREVAERLAELGID